MIKHLAFAALLVACTPRLDVRSATDEASDRIYVATGLRPHAAVTLIQGKMSCAGVRHAYGCTSWNGRHTSVSTEIPDQDVLVQTLVHEGLHSLGCRDHVLAGQGIMARDNSSALSRITSADLALVCELAPCRWKKAEQ